MRPVIPSTTPTATVPSPAGRWGHVPALDGIRGLAVLGVLAHHLGYLRGGYLGVDAFFVLSGFLITSILLDEWATDRRIVLSRFWVRRAKRLLPALLVVLATVAVVERWLTGGLSPTELRRESLATLGYVFNWYAILDDVDYWAGFTTPSPLRHMWSLAIEEQFYVVWPLVVAGLGWSCRRFGVRLERSVGIVAVVGVAASIALAQVVWSPTDLLRVYYGTDTRIAAILMGVVAAVSARRFGVDRSAMPHRPGFAVAGLVLCIPIAWAWATLDGTDPILYRGGLVATGLATTGVVVLTFRSPGTVLDRALSIRPLCWIGRVSYGLYLWHWPIIVWLTPERTGLDEVGLLVVRLIASFALTVASYHLIEQPIRRSRSSGRRTLSVAIPAMVGLGAAVVAVTAGAASAVSTDRPEAGTLSTLPIPLPPPVTSATTTDGTVALTPSAQPTEPVENAVPLRLMVVGDSGAYFIGELLLTASQERDDVVLPRGMIGCGVVNLGGGAHSDLGFLPDPPDCERWPERWSEDADVFLPTDVLLVLSWPGIGDRELDGEMRHPCDPDFDAYHRERLEYAITVAGRSGADVWLTTSPDLASAPADDISRERIACVNQSIRRAVRSAEDAGVIVGEVRVLDLRGWVCPAEVCLTEVDGEVLRPDGLHFDGPGGLRAAEWILGELT